jgi:membrane-bound lytic murein transglycosylase D
LTPVTLQQEMERVENLFRQGSEALAEGRESQARESFDAALDIFVGFKGPEASTEAFQSAYQDLVGRIHIAEVARGTERRTVPMSIQVQAALSDLPAPTLNDPPGDSPSISTLADLGERIEAITPTAEARQTNEAVLGSEVIDLPIELNDQVLGAIDLYSGRFKNWFSRALSRGLPHLPRIREILAQAGIPQDLAYVPIVESAFNPAALSRAKAKGLWQFIPSTGKQYGLKQDFFVDERSNMEKATVAAAQYLKNLYALFGDWNLALAGYNAGEGNVQRAIRRSQTSDFWALAKTRSFRSETKNYVPLIHAAIVIAKSPESYGIDLSPEELTAAETVRVAGSYPIATVARCANAEPAEIKLLNPDLRRGMTPSSAFDLKVPNGSADQVTACLAGERAMNYTRHVVRKRDTFSGIANMFGVSAAEIARVNGLTLKSRLKPGTELAIPRSSHSGSATVAVSAKSNPRPRDGAYRIRKGDTLSSVAARHSTTVEAIKALNGLNSSRLSIGQVLRVTSSASESSPE